MKLTDAVRIHAHTLCGTRGESYGKINHLHGEQFYAVWGQIWNISALEVQTPDTKNNVVSRVTFQKHDHSAQTPGVFRFSPEKTRGAVDRSLPPCLLGRGGSNPFLPLTPLPALTYTNDKARTDHSGQPSNHDSKEYDGREQPGRPDLNLLCPPSRESSPT